MSRSLTFLLALATVSVGAQAYSADAAGQGTSPSTQPQPAPIVHAYADQNGSAYPNSNPQASSRRVISTQPIPGIWLRVDPSTSVQTVSADAKGTEIRVVHGIANVSVHHPGQGARILVDLPGGQISLLKDGMYTFNADTNIVRVLKGEADAFAGSAVKGIKVKEDHQFTLAAAANGSRPVEVSRDELMSDYLTGGNGDPRGGEGYGRPGYGPYGDGFYGYPPLAYGYYGYPYGWGYPYGYGLGLGFGYYGGFGGFRGGYGGFRGRFR